MIDYKGIQALHTVITLQSFEAAAQKLFITQSAVSQRIKSLESYYGTPVLTRTIPYQPTEIGGILLTHYKKLLYLEDILVTQLQQTTVFPRISIAINRDSLETWFQHVVARLQQIPQLLIEITADDQDLTIHYLKKGLVTACLSSSKKPITGGKAQFLGNMDYILVASPEFQQRYFNNKTSVKTNLLAAPAVIFDNNDKTHSEYLKKYFNITQPPTHYHLVPSVARFKQFAMCGYGYALIPKIDISEELASGELIALFPNKAWHMGLYWHSWELASTLYKTFNNLVITIANQLLS